MPIANVVSTFLSIQSFTISSGRGTVCRKPFPRTRIITIGARASTPGNLSFFSGGVSKTRNIGAAQLKRVLKMLPTMGWAGSATPFWSAATSRFRFTKLGRASKPGTRLSQVAWCGSCKVLRQVS